MTWSFAIVETSNGAYRCTGTRHTGNTVSIQCGEDDLHRVFTQAYELEVALGTLPSRALFFVVSGAKPDWHAEYHEKTFGSWVVESSKQGGRFVYDGKDFLFMVYGSGQQPMWQGRVREKDDVQVSIFQRLLHESG